MPMEKSQSFLYKILKFCFRVHFKSNTFLFLFVTFWLLTASHHQDFFHSYACVGLFINLLYKYLMGAYSVWAIVAFSDTVEDKVPALKKVVFP